jgi:plasmid stability protein
VGLPDGLTYLSRLIQNESMEQKAIRTSIDLPRDLHRKLHEAAARKGCSARKLILASIEQAVAGPEPSRPPRRLTLDKSLVPPAGRRIDLTNEEIYDLIEFP